MTTNGREEVYTRLDHGELRLAGSLGAVPLASTGAGDFQGSYIVRKAGDLKSETGRIASSRIS